MLFYSGGFLGEEQEHFLVIMCLIDNYWFSINNDKKTTFILKVSQFQKELCTIILFSMRIWNSEIMHTLRLSKDISKYTVDKMPNFWLS